MWFFNNIFGSGSSRTYPSRVATITILNFVSSGSSISVVTPSIDYDITGNVIGLGSSFSIFIANTSIQIFLNGQLLNKTLELTWLSESTFSFSRDLYPGEEIQIFN